MAKKILYFFPFVFLHIRLIINDHRLYFGRMAKINRVSFSTKFFLRNFWTFLPSPCNALFKELTFSYGKRAQK